MPRISLTSHAQQLLKARLTAGDIAIDATVGNGHDTAFLLSQVQATGQVYGFDIQAAAITAVQAKLGAPPNLHLIAANHADIASFIPAAQHGNIRACMFNLGYLPGGDKTVITQTPSTLTALTAASQLLAIRGLLSIIVYPGHPGGDEEAHAVQAWAEQLPREQFTLSQITSQTASASAPRLLMVEKIAG